MVLRCWSDYRVFSRRPRIHAVKVDIKKGSEKKETSKLSLTDHRDHTYTQARKLSYRAIFIYHLTTVLKRTRQI